MGTEYELKSLALLFEISITLKAMLALAQQRTAKASGAPTVNLDGPRGNPVVKAKDPRDWSGDSMNGRTFSQCPPEYLDLLADRSDFFARKNEDDGDKKKAGYARTDAALARGWAERLRAGWTAPEPVATEGGDPTW